MKILLLAGSEYDYISGHPENMRQMEDYIDRVSGRAVAFTGHRGSGVTSTAVNVAPSAFGCGLKTIYTDMDVHYRAPNFHLDEFGTQADKDEDIASSLVRILDQPTLKTQVRS